MQSITTTSWHSAAASIVQTARQMQPVQVCYRTARRFSSWLGWFNGDEEHTGAEAPSVGQMKAVERDRRAHFTQACYFGGV